MNRSIRRIALGLGLAFLALFVQLNIVQVGRSRALSEDPMNRRNILQEYGTRRGEILAADDTVLAESVASDGGQYKYYRRYPLDDLFGNITGYYSFFYGTSGLERSYDETLLGKEPATTQDLVDQLLGKKPEGNVLVLSVEPKMQRLARRALGRQRGAVAAINPKTGAVLALWGTPGYDPGPLSRSPSDREQIERAWQRLTSDRRKPLTFRATSERYPPGSTFKIIVAAAALESGMTPSTTFPDPGRLDLPDTDKSLGNYGGGSCAGGRISILQGFRVSCNTTFAQAGMCVTFNYRCPTRLRRRVSLGAMATRFNINRTLDFDISSAPSCVKSIAGGCGDPDDLTRPGAAYSAIGQQDVRMTALQMAVVAATVQNGGFVPRPYLVQKVLDPTGKVLSETDPQRSRRIWSRRTATSMRLLMRDVVQNGTGRCVGFKDARRGVIGGKTGTAQTGVQGQAPHVWFVAWSPDVAVAAVVENGGDLGKNATGGKVAGPIARSMIERRLAPRSC